jgi:hypothetical protein
VGAFIMTLDPESKRKRYIPVPEIACVARWVEDGSDHGAGEICGRTDTRRLGRIWLCPFHFRDAMKAVREEIRAEMRAEALTDHVRQDTCVSPRYSGRLNPLEVPLCGKPAEGRVGNAGFCGKHMDAAFAWHDELVGQERGAERQLEIEAKRRRKAEMASWEAHGSQIVYYLRRADGAVKIGTSINLANRLIALQREHGQLEILLTHCGDHPRETEMHKRFADLCIGGEWFRLEETLLEWIVHVRRKRANVTTVMPDTVPLRYILGLLREVQQQAA